MFEKAYSRNFSWDTFYSVGNAWTGKQSTLQRGICWEGFHVIFKHEQPALFKGHVCGVERCGTGGVLL
jgi:hypothetical protein